VGAGDQRRGEDPVIDRDKMHGDLIELREARETIWQRAARAISDWSRIAFKPVAAEQCPGCAEERKRTLHWQARAGEWATECLRVEQALASTAAQLKAARKLLKDARGGASASVKSRPLPYSMRRHGKPTNGWQDSGCTRVDGKPAITTAEIFE